MYESVNAIIKIVTMDNDTALRIRLPVMAYP